MKQATLDFLNTAALRIFAQISNAFDVFFITSIVASFSPALSELFLIFRKKA